MQNQGIPNAIRTDGFVRTTEHARGSLVYKCRVRIHGFLREHLLILRTSDA